MKGHFSLIKNRIPLLIFFVGIVIYSQPSFSQNSVTYIGLNPAVEIDVSAIPGADTTSDVISLLPDSTLCNYLVYILLADTSNILSFDIKAGTTVDSFDIIHTTLNYDQYEGLPAGIVYSRTGNQVIINIGKYMIKPNYYSLITVHKNNNNEEVIRFSSNLN